MRKGQLRLVITYQGHTLNEWHSWDLNPGLSYSKPILCSSTICCFSVFQVTFCLLQLNPLISGWFYHKAKLYETVCISVLQYLANFKSISQPLSKTQKDYKLHEGRQACCSQVPHRQNAARAGGVILDHISSSLWNGKIRMDLGNTSKEWAPLEWSLLGSSAMGSSLQELFKNELSKLFKDQSCADSGWTGYLHRSF